MKKSAGHRLGWRVDLVFQIHEKDLELLKSIQAYFGGVGVITKPHRNMCAFRITSPEEISQKVLAHFDKYPLITKKYADYLLFKEITLIMLQGGHLNKEGLQTIVNIRASLNLGLSEVLNAAFPKTVPVPRPQQEQKKIPDPE